MKNWTGQELWVASYDDPHGSRIKDAWLYRVHWLQDIFASPNEQSETPDFGSLLLIGIAFVLLILWGLHQS